MSIENRRQYPQEMIDAVLAEKARHRHSYEAWSAYINTLKSGPTMDILVYDTETSAEYEHLLHQWFMAPVSDDIGEALGNALAGHGITWVTFTEDGNGPTEVSLSAGAYSGDGSSAHDFDDDDNYVHTERLGEFDNYSSARARAVCLALLDMYSPTEEELATGSPAE